MAEGTSERTVGDVLAAIDTAIDVLLDEHPGVGSGRDRLDLLVAALRVAGRFHAWQARLAARLDDEGTAWTEHGTSTSTWLADVANLTRREAGRLVAAGHGLGRFDVVGRAAASGAVLPEQGEAITGVLDDLPEDVRAADVAEAQALMVGFAATHNSSELRRLTGRLLELLDPAGAEAREADRVEREHRLAMRSRHLSFTHDHHGSLLFRGSLPVAEAEPFVRIIDAYAAAARRGLDRLDRLADHLTPAMHRADALLALVDAHAQQALAPSHGGDRPRVVVTLSYDTLLKAATDGGAIGGRLVGSGAGVPAGVLRQWLCDADVLPAVLGGRSEVLDVGRSERLVTPAIRAALELRDGGCVFPGCEVPPQNCHAHHIVPWWDRRHCATWCWSVRTTTASSNRATTRRPTGGASTSRWTGRRRSFRRCGWILVGGRARTHASSR